MPNDSNNTAKGGSSPASCSSSFVRMFKPQFAGLVERGEKLQTVRPIPKRMPKTGDRISLRAWEGKPYRSKQRVLREAVVATAEPITISEKTLERGLSCWVYGGGRSRGMDHFAQADGFKDWPALVEWFRETHGLPFSGVLIRWTNAKPTHR
jgi:hypothetical protein